MNISANENMATIKNCLLFSCFKQDSNKQHNNIKKRKRSINKCLSINNKLNCLLLLIIIINLSTSFNYYYYETGNKFENKENFLINSLPKLTAVYATSSRLLTPFGTKQLTISNNELLANQNSLYNQKIYQPIIDLNHHYNTTVTNNKTTYHHHLPIVVVSPELATNINHQPSSEALVLDRGRGESIISIEEDKITHSSNQG